MEYDLVARKRLGRAVRSARLAAGYGNRNDFADVVKRSARQVQALENGESGVGPDTLASVAAALGWELEKVYAILDGRQETDRSPSAALTDVSDEDLAAEVLRRMKAGGEHGGDTAATNDPGPRPGTVTQLEAARKEGTLSKGQQRQRNAERAGEPEPDDPDDFEPR